MSTCLNLFQTCHRIAGCKDLKYFTQYFMLNFISGVSNCGQLAVSKSLESSLSAFTMCQIKPYFTEGSISIVYLREIHRKQPVNFSSSPICPVAVGAYIVKESRPRAYNYKY